ncbi:hypothetical protein Tco_0992396 [Tanacetum coccineum]|uniref:Retrotransposon gag domain-containing protein n=1 Tax=Tanacetum coccineum TaxID=301880 RepID=A0ABQ5F3N4_9ASTR
MSASMEACIAKHAAAPTPPLPVASSPLPLPSPLTTRPTDAGAPLGYRAARIRMRAAVASPPLLLPPTSPRTDVPEADKPLGKSLSFILPRPGYEIGEVRRLIRELYIARIAWTSSGERMQAHRGTCIGHWRHRKMIPNKRSTRTTPATTTTPTTTVTDAQLQALIDQGVAAALAERDASRSRDGDNSHGSGTGGRRQVPTLRECTYTDFLKCQPMNFKGTEGVVGLTQWVEKMESVFLISSYAITSQVKFASCTLQGSALTWWNSHVRAIGQDVAYAMPWTALKRMITDKYYPRGKIKKLESEYWN